MQLDAFELRERRRVSLTLSLSLSWTHHTSRRIQTGHWNHLITLITVRSPSTGRWRRLRPRRPFPSSFGVRICLKWLGIAFMLIDHHRSKIFSKVSLTGPAATEPLQDAHPGISPCLGPLQGRQWLHSKLSILVKRMEDSFERWKTFLTHERRKARRSQSFLGCCCDPRIDLGYKRILF